MGKKKKSLTSSKSKLGLSLGMSKFASRRDSKMSSISKTMSIMDGSDSKASPRFDQTLSSIEGTPRKEKAKDGASSTASNFVMSRESTVALNAAMPSIAESSPTKVSKDAGVGAAEKDKSGEEEVKSGANAIAAMM